VSSDPNRSRPYQESFSPAAGFRRHRVSGGLILLLLAAALAEPLPAQQVLPNDLGSRSSLEATARPLTVADIAGLHEAALLRAERLVADAIASGALPGAALAIGRGEQLVLRRGLGRADFGAAADPISPDGTLYDLASLTKVLATTAAVMLLYEDGVIELDAPVVQYIPEFRGRFRDAGIHRMTVRHLLTHTAGYPAGSDLRAPNRIEMRQRALHTALVGHPGRHMIYSDVGYTVLWELASRLADEPLHRLLDRRIYAPLGMSSTTFLPGAPCRACAPTGQLRGSVHDGLARALGGIAGHAGLFATLEDVGRFAAMMAGGGTLGGERIFAEETVRTFTAPQEGAYGRALGWDTGHGVRYRRPASIPLASEPSFGHNGYTGTSLWVDPEQGTWVVLLTNRTLGRWGPEEIRALRRAVHEEVAGAVLPGEAVEIRE